MRSKAVVDESALDGTWVFAVDRDHISIWVLTRHFERREGDQGIDGDANEGEGVLTIHTPF